MTASRPIAVNDHSGRVIDHHAERGDRLFAVRAERPRAEPHRKLDRPWTTHPSRRPGTTPLGEGAPELTATTVTENGDGGTKLGRRAARTRATILDASKKLFLERGYAGTRINRQRTPTDVPEALGLAIQSMMDRAWYHTHVQRLASTMRTWSASSRTSSWPF